MFADTITFTYAGSPVVLTRIREQGSTSVYRHRAVDGTFLCTIKQTSYKDATRGVTVKRHAVDLVLTIDPVAPKVIPEVRKSYTVIENDEVHAVAQLIPVVSAVADFVKVAANAEKLIGEEY